MSEIFSAKSRLLSRLKKAVVILNPGSHAHRGTGHWDDWLSALRRAGIELETHQTRTLDDAQQWARQAEHADVVVAVGGDGTINRVLSGLMASPAPRPALAVLYTGTSPDFCRFQGIPLDHGRALATILARRIRAVDIVRIEYRDAAGNPAAASFGSSANIGIGAHAAARANRWRPFLGEYVGTGLAVLSTLGDVRPTLTVRLDGGPAVLLPGCVNLTIAKNPLIASGLKTGDTLAPDDGLLAALGVYDLRLSSLLRLFPSFYSGCMPAGRGIFQAHCRQAVITADRACPLEFDGDPHGYLPVTIEIMPRALQLMVEDAGSAGWPTGAADEEEVQAA